MERKRLELSTPSLQSYGSIAETPTKQANPEHRDRPPSDTASSSTANQPSEAPTDPGLAAVVGAWPDLPPALRAGIVAMVRASTPLTEDR
jgi:hypothetical protein